MKRTSFFLFLFMCYAGSAFCHPSTGAALSYDQDSKTLKIEIKHTTSDMVKHHIRRLIVYKNKQEIQSFTIVHQTTPNSVVKEVSVDAVPGDILTVEAYCNEGGTTTQDLIVPEPSAKEPGQPG